MSTDNKISVTPELLQRCCLLDGPQAARNFDALWQAFGEDGCRDLVPRVLAVLPRTADPDMALNNLERFAGSLANVPAFLLAARQSPSLVPALLAVLGASAFLSDFLAAHADESAARMADPAYLARPAARRVLADRLALLLERSQNDKDLYRSLRHFRKQEMLRIALRDLLGKGELPEIVGELSDLAEVCLEAAYQRVRAGLEARFGRPLIVRPDGSTAAAGFAVIAMGKLGGRELNFSSDIDLMYVYASDGETEGGRTGDGPVPGRISNHEFFVKLSEKLSAAIGQTTEDGFVFRVDLRLRPEGQRGPLAQSLGGYEIYYESWGQTWERSALIKARPVAGDAAVGREFMERITPFVYRKYLDHGSIVEIRDMKIKINREVQQKGREHRDVKLGYGGIREIEFLTQALQLMYGGREKTLRERGTLRSLHLLSQKGLLTYQETADLSRAYVFLRTVEHRLQMLNDLQTQTLPQDRSALRALARRTGYLEPGKEIDGLLGDYVRHTETVRRTYDVLLAQTGGDSAESDAAASLAALLDPQAGEKEALAVFGKHGFRDPRKAFRNLELLRDGEAFLHQTPRSRRQFNEVFPLLYEEIIASPDPDMALNHLESFFAVQGSWDAFQAFARQNPAMIKVLTSVFANSEYFSRMLIRSTLLLQELLDTGRSASLGAPALMRADLEAALAKAGGISEKLDALRRFKHREEVRIGMADLRFQAPLTAVCRGLSRLAEACLSSALALAAAEMGKRYADEMRVSGIAVIGAGKLGGRELSYGSDLDILFVCPDELAGAAPAGISGFEFVSKIAEKTISYLTTMTREGSAYRVDTRLRPTGSKGPLVQSIGAFRSYYADQAETWERQSLVNARFVAGDRGVGLGFLRTMEDLVFRADVSTLGHDVRAMRKRMEDELGKEDEGRFNIKQGYGGLVDIDFLAQYLQLLHGRRLPAVRVPGTYNALRSLRKQNLLDREVADFLLKAYLFFRMLESRMRIVSNQATHELLRDPGKLRSLARRMGYEGEGAGPGERLLADYERVRREVRSAFERHVPA